MLHQKNGQTVGGKGGVSQQPANFCREKKWKTPNTADAPTGGTNIIGECLGEYREKNDQTRRTERLGWDR